MSEVAEGHYTPVEFTLDPLGSALLSVSPGGRSVRALPGCSRDGQGSAVALRCAPADAPAPSDASSRTSEAGKCAAILVDLRLTAGGFAAFGVHEGAIGAGAGACALGRRSREVLTQSADADACYLRGARGGDAAPWARVGAGDFVQLRVDGAAGIVEYIM